MDTVQRKPTTHFGVELTQWIRDFMTAERRKRTRPFLSVWKIGHDRGETEPLPLNALARETDQ